MTEVIDSELVKKIASAIEATDDVINKVPADLRESAYPVILELLVKGDSLSSTDSDTISGSRSPNAAGENFLKRPMNQVFARIRPKTNVDRALLIACCIEARDEMVNVAALIEGFKEARIPPASNMAGSVGSLLKRGHLMISDQAGNARDYSVTVDGNDYVEKLVDTAVSAAE